MNGFTSLIICLQNNHLVDKTRVLSLQLLDFGYHLSHLTFKGINLIGLHGAVVLLNLQFVFERFEFLVFGIIQ
jgi:hypothetical protein